MRPSTLIERLMAVAIVAILAALLLPALEARDSAGPNRQGAGSAADPDQNQAVTSTCRRPPRVLLSVGCSGQP